MSWELLNYKLYFFENYRALLIVYLTMFEFCLFVVFEELIHLSEAVRFLSAKFSYNLAVIFLIPVRSLVIFLILFLIMPIFVFFPYMFVSLVRDLSILLVYYKRPAFYIDFICFTIFNFFDF